MTQLDRVRNVCFAALAASLVGGCSSTPDGGDPTSSPASTSGTDRPSGESGDDSRGGSSTGTSGDPSGPPSDDGSSTTSVGAESSGTGAEQPPTPADYEPCEPTHDPSNYTEGLAAGGFICLADGVYSGSLQVPSDTHVKSATLFGARFVGGGEQGIVSQQGDNSIVEGIHASHPLADNRGSCMAGGTNNQFLDMACIGAGQHRYAVALSIGGDGNLVQNVTVGGDESRYLASCYLGDNITVRNLLGIWSGGPSPENGGAGEPTAVVTNYSCSDMLWENIVALDPAYSYVPFGGIVKLATEFDEANHRVTYNGIVVRADPDVVQDQSFMKAIDADSKNTSGGRSTEISVANVFIRDMGIGAIVKDTYDWTMTNCTLVDVPGGAGQIGFGPSEVPLSCDGTADISPMFPWPNEAAVKDTLCEERASKWCSFPGSLQSYILD